MRIGIVGVGTVGSAVRFGLETKRGHDVAVHDIKMPETSLESVYGASEMIFICVGTPRGPNGSCDTSAVERVCASIEAMAKERGETKDVVVKSTVIPGTVSRIERACPSLRLAMNPEFLLEKAAVQNFCDQDVCVIGTNHDGLYSAIVEAHGNLAREYVRTTPVNAETVKYFLNAFNSTRIIFANLFYEVCGKVGADYDEVKGLAVRRSNMIDSYLDCNKNLRGFGGACLPKDTEALLALAAREGVQYDFLNGVLADNRRINDAGQR